MTLEEIGERFDLTPRSQQRQIKEKAIRRLKHELQPHLERLPWLINPQSDLHWLQRMPKMQRSGQLV